MKNGKKWRRLNSGALAEGEVVEGRYEKVEHTKGKRGEKLTWHTVAGRRLLGGAVLNSCLPEAGKPGPNGPEVRITYRGLGEAKGKQNPPRLYDVEVAE